MGRVVTRSTTLKSHQASSRSSAPQTSTRAGEQTNSSANTSKVRTGRSRKAKGKAKGKQRMSKLNTAELEDTIKSLSLSVPLPDKSDEEDEKKSISDVSDSGSEPECSICLQEAVHPVKLPCNHIFCFLCIKGVVHSSMAQCALCRAPVPQGFVFNPNVIKEVKVTEDEYTWYYEGRGGGWWEYDCRTSQELEELHSAGVKEIDMMIAGYIYIIDFNSMVQKRKTAQQIQRKIKRDKNVIDKIGVAGLKPTRPQR